MRFPGFDGEWIEKTIESFSSRIGDGIHGTPQYDDSGEYYFINGNNLVGGKILINDQTKKVSRDEAIKHKRGLSNRTLLLSINGTIGNIAFYKEEKVMLGKSAAYINIGEETDIEFIYHTLRTPKIQYYFYSELTGSTIKNLSLRSIRETKLKIPSFPEQEKVGSFFKAIDSRIQTQNKIIEDYKLLKEGLMQKIFNQELRFKDENGNPYTDWTEKKIGEILKIGSGKDYKHLEPGNIPVYGTGGYITSVDDFLFEGKSVGIGRKGTIDKPVFLDGKFWTVDTLFYTHSFDGATPYFVFILFQRINWLKYNEASGVPSLSKASIGKIKVKIPIVEEQQKIASILSAVDKKIELEIEYLEKFKAQKQYLLQNLFV